MAGRIGNRSTRRGDTKTVVIIVICVAAAFGLMLCGVAALFIIPALGSARTAAQRTESKNHLKMMGLALHNYHDTYKTFPLPIYDGETPYNNWQTSILPFLEQNLAWSTLDQDQPWSAPVNEGVYRMPVPEYLNPSIAEQFDANGLALSHYAGNSQVFSANRPMRIADFSDGTSNTILVGEVAAGFRPWGDPENVRDPAAGIHFDARTFGNSTGDGSQFLMGDGAVKFISADVNPAVMQALATPNAGDMAGDF